MDAFKPGETVVAESGVEFEIVSGPHSHMGAETYWVKNDRIAGIPVLTSALSRKGGKGRARAAARFWEAMQRTHWKRLGIDPDGK